MFNKTQSYTIRTKHSGDESP